MNALHSLPAAEPLIRLRGLSKSFGRTAGRNGGKSGDRDGGVAAVRDVSLDIGAGEIFGIAGRSGAGKSTLLRLFNLLEQPDAGTVTVDGQELTRLDKRALRAARQNIGMIFQGFNLLQNATVAGNVAFPLEIHGGRSREEIARRVADCLALVHLEDKPQAYPAQLSGGQRQRVAIARALASGPAVLLCDEPTSALDAETTRSILATLRDVNARLNVTIVIVSHELDVLAALCHRVAVIDGGEVAEIVSPETPHAITALGRELVSLFSAPSSALASSPSSAPSRSPAREVHHA
ncbi:ATP-binding cassette domain-containing protein [Massilia dura]|uniref:ATP-binding cassette domain-containing protein n=1 Tax=Pseudoduganella dura TaxID=321982 RepID=A0A6I3XM23_9BURK|nr:ATP-binding cassette domain-containing protein [Pseudoduganella dura]MUI15590.1 ATP-binding cassette domain-containing protein [Pseudoduganella dura]GGY13097.1 methionine ABC transporter ATP-binding protein [Pseudoduganella dura]